MNALQSFLGGMMSGCFSTLCNNPLDVIKTRMQGRSDVEEEKGKTCVVLPCVLGGCLTVLLLHIHTYTGLDAAKYNGTLDCAKQIIKHEGAGTFLKGLVPRLGRVVPGQGIIFMSFETIQNALAEALL